MAQRTDPDWELPSARCLLRGRGISHRGDACGREYSETTSGNNKIALENKSALPQNSSHLMKLSNAPVSFPIGEGRGGQGRDFWTDFLAGSH